MSKTNCDFCEKASYFVDENGESYCLDCLIETVKNPLESEAMKEHQLRYSIWSAKVTWCPICHKHFYDTADNKHVFEEKK